MIVTLIKMLIRRFLKPSHLVKQKEVSLQIHLDSFLPLGVKQIKSNKSEKLNLKWFVFFLGYKCDVCGIILQFIICKRGEALFLFYSCKYWKIRNDKIALQFKFLGKMCFSKEGREFLQCNFHLIIKLWFIRHWFAYINQKCL